jgi:F420H(2)-dependent quinone reductase
MNWTKLFTTLNVYIYKASNGRLGNRMGKQSVLLLYTTGHKTAKPYTTTLSFYREGDNYLVVASNWGKETQPGWFHNLMHQPHTMIQVGAMKISVQARSADGEEYERLWKLVTAKNDQYIKYQSTIKRRIPIVVLTPNSPS